MNHRFPLRAVVFVSLTLLFGACSDTSQHIADVDGLIVQSDTVSKELAAVDPTDAARLYSASGELKDQFKQVVKNDTLDLEFAEKLDRYLKANKQLAGLPEEREQCLEANTAAKKRLTNLAKDLQAGAGDRSKYAEFVAAEKREMAKIRSHSAGIALRYTESKSAIEQFQPDIERFISQFVSP